MFRFKPDELKNSDMFDNVLCLDSLPDMMKALICLVWSWLLHSTANCSSLPIGRYSQASDRIYLLILPRQVRQAQLQDPYPDKPRITFRDDGTFKITVFSDMHWGENPWDVWGPQQDANSTILMNKVLGSEKPDFV